MKSKENNNLEINTTEEVLEITNNPIELIYVVETQEAVTLPTQTSHKTQEELDGIIADFFKANCCMTDKKKIHFTQLLTDQYWA
jgi:hypothetical protein